MEFVRMINFLIKFGLFIYRKNTFQSQDIELIFNFLCYICDIFTNRSDIESLNSLDKIISKDKILTDHSKMNPVQKAAYDIKYALFNKSFTNTSIRMGEFDDYEDKTASKNFHIKLLTEITQIFHMFIDLRQHYLMSNNVEFFYSNIFLKYSGRNQRNFSSEKTDEINSILLKEFIHLIPDSYEFHSHMNYELPSIDKMYESEELELQKESMNRDEIEAAEMHDEYAGLMIDTFNMHSYDPLLRQLIILLICRYHSERAEFIRNLDRTILFFDNNDWMFYCWVQQQLDKFIFNSEKSYIWLQEIKIMLNEINNNFDEFKVSGQLLTLTKILKEMKKAVVYNWKINEDEYGQLDIVFEKGDRKINVYTQDLYRNSKVYDYLINFLFQNKELLIKVRKIEYENLQPNKEKVVRAIRKVFQIIFRILEIMTVNNIKTQDLMWKYKEDFVFDQLEETEQEGELELVLAIINDSEHAIHYQQNRWSLSKTR
jgi:hypothetical protein